MLGSGACATVADGPDSSCFTCFLLLAHTPRLVRHNPAMGSRIFSTQVVKVDDKVGDPS
ncbi:hypothetical protein BC830DRAFT_1166833 [Chytriomyces sp. MP71]|nr:hypothetical protein BC830DRAFT_1166833 [Chytriomyces sp. MP71]